LEDCDDGFTLAKAGEEHAASKAVMVRIFNILRPFWSQKERALR
jgi:hypothetical protein